ncbi:SSU0592/SSU0593 family protein [Streptococcus suis]
MKQLVTKRSYKIGLSAMALVLLMTTAGGAVAHAEEITVYISPKGSESFISVEKPNIGGFAEGVVTTESINNSNSHREQNKSLGSRFWAGLKRFWSSWCCGFGLRGLKSK